MAAYGNAGKDGAPAEVSEASFFDRYWYPWRLFAQAGGRAVMPSHQLTTAFMLPSHAKITYDVATCPSRQPPSKKTSKKIYGASPRKFFSR